MKKYVFLPFALVLLMLASTAQDNKFSTYYNQRRTLFELLPDTKNEIIFLGNSITDGSEWVELFGDLRVKNRGISGDTTEGVLYRLNEVTRSKPDKVFILIGINDLSRNVPKDTVFQNICTIASRIRKSSPKTNVFVQSILPVNASLQKFPNHTNKGEEVLWVNQQLKSWCEANQFAFIDLFSRFKNPNDDLLNPAYTNDGLHLTGEGYVLWAGIVKPLVFKK